MLNCGDSQSRAVTKIFLNRGILFEIFLDGEVVQGTQLTDSMGAFFACLKAPNSILAKKHNRMIFRV